MHKQVGEAYAIIQCPECKYKNAEANLDVPLKIPLFTNNNDWTIQVYITVQSFDRRESRDLSDSRFAIRKLILRLLFQLNNIIPGIRDIIMNLWHINIITSIPNLSILW